MKVLLTSLVVLFLCTAFAKAGVFTTRRPWCFDDHLHFYALEEIKEYYDMDPYAYFAENELDKVIHHTFETMRCSEIEAVGKDCCTVSFFYNGIVEGCIETTA